MSLLEIQQLSISFQSYNFRLQKQIVTIVQELSLSIQAGEIVSIVGASGSGKSLLAHAILGLLPDNAVVSGKLLYAGKPLTPNLQRDLRGKELALIPQSVQFLDPLMPVGRQVEHAIRKGNAKLEREKVFEQFQLASSVAKLYPYQLSGGMARRILVSIAAISGAKLLIADEPTPGLDEEVAMETLRAFQQLSESGTSILFITHDLIAAAKYSHRIAVLHNGRLIDIAPASSFTGNGDKLAHPYTRALWQALPQHEFYNMKGWPQ